MSKLILVRHGDSIKNAHGDRIGGCGPLTDQGRRQCHDLALELSRLDLCRPSVFAADREQCRESAQVIADGLGADVKLLALSAYNLGRISGVSLQDLREREPGLAGRLVSWQRGDLDIANVRLPGSEDPDEYYTRALKVVQDLMSLTFDSVVVGTRSILIAMYHALRGNSPRIPGLYRAVPFECARFQLESIYGG